MREKNSFFLFKQFTVRQARSAMKVCTDSCLLGAVAQPPLHGRILDIGTGTGLLSLMLAQKTEAMITAVEIDPEAAKEAAANFQDSPWAGRLQVLRASFQDYVKTSGTRFDFIISNPPFFEDNLLTGNPHKDLALHSTALSLEELAEGVAALLSPRGRFTYMLPVYESSVLLGHLKRYGIRADRIDTVYHREGNKALREIVRCGFTKKEAERDSIIIRSAQNQYTERFRELLEPYYLIF